MLKIKKITRIKGHQFLSGTLVLLNCNEMTQINKIYMGSETFLLVLQWRFIYKKLDNKTPFMKLVGRLLVSVLASEL